MELGLGKGQGWTGVKDCLPGSGEFTVLRLVTTTTSPFSHRTHSRPWDLSPTVTGEVRDEESTRRDLFNELERHV